MSGAPLVHGLGEMLTLHTPAKRLEARGCAASSRSKEGLWWSIRKIEKLSVTARLDAFPAGVGGVPGSPGSMSGRFRVPGGLCAAAGAAFRQNRNRNRKQAGGKSPVCSPGVGLELPAGVAGVGRPHDGGAGARHCLGDARPGAAHPPGGYLSPSWANGPVLHLRQLRCSKCLEQCVAFRA